MKLNFHDERILINIFEGISQGRILRQSILLNFIIFSEQISMFACKFNHNKNIQKFRSQILMQFLPIPIVNLVRPAPCPISLPQMMSFALAADFKKYALAYVLNDLPSSQKDEKKTQNAQTSISTSSFEEIIQGKTEENAVQLAERNRKKSDSFQTTKKNEEKVQLSLPKKRQCYERARCQITQALESSQESKQEQEKQSIGQEELIIYKDKIEGKIEQIKEKLFRKQKKIQKVKKYQKVVARVEQQEKVYISTMVSLIDTIDHPQIIIDRFEIQRKRQHLLSRAIVYDQMEQRKRSYQIRERREPKKLN